MTAEGLGRVGPGHGPGGSPLAIAISPILTGRDAFGSMRSKILEAAPGSHLIAVNSEGHAEEPLEEAEVLLRGWALGGDPLDRLVGRAPKLRWIHSVSVGVESVLTPCVLLRGLTVTNGRGVFDRPIAEYVMTMILAVTRRLPQLLELQRERTWQPLEAQEMSSVTVGLVGLGGIGAQVAEFLHPFGSRVVAVRRNASAPAPAGVEILGGLEALPRLLALSDFVVLALPLTTETDKVIDDEALSLMKPGAWIVNVARGGLIEERALLRELRSGRLGGAVLDTFRDEPLTDSSAFYQVPNCIVTPHTSWSSGAVLGRTFDVFCDNLRRYAAGEPLLHVVDPKAGY